MNITNDWIWITLSFLLNCPKCKLGIGIRVDQNYACVCARALACMRVRMGLVLRVCLQVRCGAPPRSPALDPPLGSMYVIASAPSYMAVRTNPKFRTVVYHFRNRE